MTKEYTQEQFKLERYEKVAKCFVADMPQDVCLKGDGSIWIKPYSENGNNGVDFRKASQEEVLKFMFKSIQAADKLFSV